MPSSESRRGPSLQVTEPSSVHARSEPAGRSPISTCLGPRSYRPRSPVDVSTQTQYLDSHDQEALGVLLRKVRARCPVTGLQGSALRWSAAFSASAASSPFRWNLELSGLERVQAVRCSEEVTVLENQYSVVHRTSKSVLRLVRLLCLLGRLPGSLDARAYLLERLSSSPCTALDHIFELHLIIQKMNRNSLSPSLFQVDCKVGPIPLSPFDLFP